MICTHVVELPDDMQLHLEGDACLINLCQEWLGEQSCRVQSCRQLRAPAFRLEVSTLSGGA